MQTKKRILLSLTLMLLFIVTHVHGQSPAPRQQLVSLSGEWLFGIDSMDAGVRDRWFEKGLPAHLSRQVKVPHTWNVDPGTEEYYGTAWYQKEVNIPGDVKGKSVRLQFNAVYRDATIYLNGQQIGEHKGSGYTKFYVDASGAARKGKNILTVRVSNQFSKAALPYNKSFDWSNDGGITRDVSLIVTHRSDINYILADARPVAGTKSGSLALQVVFLDKKEQQKQVQARITVFDAAQRQVFTQTQMYPLQGDRLKMILQIPEVNLWHFDHPHLYSVRVDVLEKGAIRASQTATVGFRSIAVNNSKIYLNGEAVRLSALEWMPGSNPAYGMAEPAAVIYGNLEHIKKLNAVFTRFHWQQDDQLLDWCDKHGLLVQEEIPLWGGGTGHLDSAITAIAMSQAYEMVHTHYNHPSIIAWGVGNEHYGRSANTQDYVKHMYQYIKGMDSSRLVNYVSNSIQDNPSLDATVYGDVIMWNEYYETWFEGRMTDVPAILDSIHKHHPEKPIVISEYGLCEPAFSGSDPRRIEHMLTHTAIYECKPYVAGAIYFSLNDYRTFIGEEGTGKRRQRVHGLMDLDGNPKPSYNYLRNLFSPIKLASMKTSANKSELNVTIFIPGGMPSYALTGYTACISSASGNGEILQLPLLEPSKRYTFTLKNISGNNRQVVFSRPGGFNVLSVPVNR